MTIYNYEIESLIDNVKNEHQFLSETKKEIIEGVKGNYPQLCTYESEWIYFDETGYIPGEPVEIEYQTVEGTNCIVENAIPVRFKSAILKGNTIKNEVKTVLNWYSNALDYTTFPIKANTRYLIYWNLNYAPTRVGFLYYDNDNKAQFNGTIYDESFQTKGQVILTSGNVGNNEIIRFRFDISKPSIQPSGEVMVIEYQEGMENWGIPYFEGIQSVQKPVLTTTGKNLFDGAYNKSKYLHSDGTEKNSDGWATTTNFIPVKPNTTYTQNFGKNSSIAYVVFYDKQKNIINSISETTNNWSTYTTPSNCYFIKTCFKYGTATEPFTFQIEEGTTATTYESYRINELKVNEELTLCGFGAVRDELNLLTGELTQRIGEIVLDGSDDEDWYKDSGGSSTHERYVMRRGDNLKPVSNIKWGGFLCDRFKTTSLISGQTSEEVCLMEYYDSYFISIIIDKVKLDDVSVSGFRRWLQSNNLKFEYQLEEESVKTVDLTPISTPFDGYNKFTTSSDTIPPIMNLQVPVVSTGEQTLQDINE